MSRRTRHRARSRPGADRPTIRLVAGMACARAIAAASVCTCRRCSRPWGSRSWSTTRATTGCAPYEDTPWAGSVDGRGRSVDDRMGGSFARPDHGAVPLALDLVDDRVDGRVREVQVRL